jgi:hypothetical protein
MNSIGHIVVAGRTLPIIRLELREGKLLITAFTGVLRDEPAVRDAEATVFGADGQGVCQGWLMDIPEMRAGETITITLPMQITHLELPPLSHVV